MFIPYARRFCCSCLLSAISSPCVLALIGLTFFSNASSAQLVPTREEWVSHDSDFDPHFKPSVAAGTNGRGVAVWHSAYAQHRSDGENDFYFSYSDDFGIYWRPLRPLDPVFQLISDVDPEIESDGSGIFVVVFGADERDWPNDESYSTYFARSTDDPVEGNNSRRLVPNTDGGPAWDSILTETVGPITGRLIHIDGAQQSTAMMLLPGK